MAEQSLLLFTSPPLLFLHDFPSTNHLNRRKHEVNAHALQGVAYFVGRLPAAQASAVLREVQAAAGRDAPTSAADAQYPWNLYCEFADLLSDRVAKVGAYGGLLYWFESG